MLTCGLLGRRLGHSYSPQLHALFGDYVYRLFEVEPDALADFLHSDAFDALNVTVPYKKAVLPYCAALSDTARAVGCVNTVVRRADGSLFGDNTDVFGFSRMLAGTGFRAAGKKALVFGSGGASAAVCHVLREQGAEVVVISRQGENNYVNLSRHADARLLVNATPLGMFPENGGSPCDLARFPDCECVLDVVYNPEKTALLLQAEALGIPFAGGLSMLVAQAKRSSELFTGTPLSDAVIADGIRALSRQMRNIVLIGMPGCGKSTVGAALAARLGRQLYDTDEEFARRASMSAGDYIRTYGEDAFRRAETEVVSDLCKLSGCVIATGGGVVTRPENRGLLRQNGIVVWVQRAVNALPTAGRPLSERFSAERLFAEREPLYRSFSDHSVSNDGTISACVDAILEAIQ